MSLKRACDPYTLCGDMPQGPKRMGHLVLTGLYQDGLSANYDPIKGLVRTLSGLVARPATKNQRPSII